MQLDIRVPIGMLFTLIGALLLAQGLLAAALAQRGAAPVNIDAAWGLVMVIFGAGMLLLARRRWLTGRRSAPPRPGKPGPGPRSSRGTAPRRPT